MIQSLQQSVQSVIDEGRIGSPVFFAPASSKHQSKQRTLWVAALP